MGEGSPKGAFYLHSRDTHVKLNFVLLTEPLKSRGGSSSRILPSG